MHDKVEHLACRVVAPNTCTPSLTRILEAQSKAAGYTVEDRNPELFTPAQALQDPFEQFAAVISAPKSLAAAAALLRRLESKLAAHSGATDARCEASLRRLFPAAVKGGRRVERYPTRIIFCAYMMKVQALLFSHSSSPSAELHLADFNHSAIVTRRGAGASRGEAMPWC